MAGEGISEAAEPQERAERSRRRWKRWVFGPVAAVVLLIVAGLLFLNTPIGKRFIADQIADIAPASGLRIEVGRIEGDIYRDAVLHDVVLSDPQGRFLTIPRAEIDWRPLSWLTSGIDIRKLTAERGTLLRVPELEPGDPDAPILPDFDIRIDEFELRDFTIARGVIDDRAHPLDLKARADIRDGLVELDGQGQFGEEDRFDLALQAEPDGDVFDMELDYRATRDGVLAGLVGTDAGYTARIAGDGTWTRWDGALVIRRNDERFAALTLKNFAGRYEIAGQVRPEGVLSGLPLAATGPVLSIGAIGSLEDSVLDGEIALRSAALRAFSEGSVDLADNSVSALEFRASLLNPELFGESVRLEDAVLSGTADGSFRDLTIDHQLSVAQLVSGTTQVQDITQSGVATYDGSRWTLPLEGSVARIVTGNALVDPKLDQGRFGGTLVYTGRDLLSDDLTIDFPAASARLAVRGDTSVGSYGIAGPVTMNGLPLENIGTVNGSARIRLMLASGVPWTLRAALDARIPRVTNSTIENLAGPDIRLRGNVALAGNAPIVFNDFTVDASKLNMTLDGRVNGGTTSVVGRGRQADYGPFTVEATLADEGPRAELVFASPLPAAGLENVRVAISPSADGFAIDTEGQSMIGPFNGALELISPEAGPTRIAIERLNIWKSSVTGDLTLGDDGANGRLAVSGGGLDGTIGLAARDGGQGFAVDIRARNASFAGPANLSIASADIEGRGFVPGAQALNSETLIQGSIYAEGLNYGQIFLGRVAANANLRGGEGKVTASLAGRRGSRFALQLEADVAPQLVAVAAQGSFAGEALRFPRRAVLRVHDDGGYLLEPTQLSYGDGGTIVSGEFGGGDTRLRLQMLDMPLSLIDLAVADVGLGGTISGVVDYSNASGTPPTGNARVTVDNLTRSGLVLTSRPFDLALVADLSADKLAARAVIDEDGQRRGRLQARISSLPQNGDLFKRLQTGRLFAQLRYNGPADALWRLAAIEGFDLTGPLAASANVTGTLADPQLRGSLSSDSLRVRSLISGTDVTGVSARGSFAGSRLTLSRFAGKTANDGRISGSGTIDLKDLGDRGPQMDIRIAAKDARLVDANGLVATVTGPIRIVSDGVGGTIAGRLAIDRASWQLGAAAESMALPNIRTREINIPADVRAPRARSAPWRYLINASGPSRIDVDGMGLDSEWGANIVLRGTTDDPRIGGEARVVRGYYSFAGTRFELTRGRIAFDENQPIDPRLDIVAETQKEGIEVAVTVTGNAQSPEITFNSTPALPEEEILARLLFGGSITELSATDALQLGTALASLRGGAGMDPINQLRSAIGLDRLRIVSADPALGRGTGVALGKNFGRRFYVELITDGRGYSATELEFRVTGWLSLLAAVSTVGRQSVSAEISRDY
uniref:translocation/assembly module TamB domain-containing protein n=1 Tax=Parerythrobacter lutipelagi TaxID=1964208 RepID=UPI0010F91CC1|nr:translocation/assembly module TamB domain-containing protein [Parerythrobacter lutipelagi]